MGLLDKIFGPLIKPVSDIISEVVVDKDKARELQVRLEELADQADQRFHEQMMGQMEVNKVEAAHPSIFVAGWRPFTGWVGGVGLAYAAILEPFMSWVARVNGYVADFPEIDNSILVTVLMGMLGIGTMRSFEKKNGVETKSILRRKKNDEG